MNLLNYSQGRCAGVAIAALAMLAGCGQKTPTIVPVHGVVLLDGSPLPRGTISFIPEQGRSSTGAIASDGTFELQTYGKNDGAPPGNYRVAIVAFDGPVVEDAAVKSLIPQHFGTPATSGLTFEVRIDNENDARFELNSNAKPKS